MSSVFVYEPQICINVIMYNIIFHTILSFLQMKRKCWKMKLKQRHFCWRLVICYFPVQRFTGSYQLFFLLIFLPFQIMEYYFEERLHILQCTKFLLSYWQDPRHRWRVSWISTNFYHFRSIVILNTVLMMFVWIITKKKFILTISIQYQANKWWE